jgi:hypothetical protein
MHDFKEFERRSRHAVEHPGARRCRCATSQTNSRVETSPPLPSLGAFASLRGTLDVARRRGSQLAQCLGADARRRIVEWAAWRAPIEFRRGASTWRSLDAPRAAPYRARTVRAGHPRLVLALGAAARGADAPRAKPVGLSSIRPPDRTPLARAGRGWPRILDGAALLLPGEGMRLGSGSATSRAPQQTPGRQRGRLMQRSGNVRART